MSKSNFNRFLKNHYYELYAEIEKRTIKLNQYKADRKKNGKIMDISLSERIYCLLHDLDDRPLCIECHKNKVAGFDKRKNCYADYSGTGVEQSICQQRTKQKHTLLYR